MLMLRYTNCGRQVFDKYQSCLVSLSLKLQKIKRASPVVLSNLGLKWIKSQGVCPVFLSNLGLQIEKITRGYVQQFSQSWALKPLYTFGTEKKNLPGLSERTGERLLLKNYSMKCSTF